ncbi:MAG: WcaI family glycosyltransferase [Novosphingobium sp.]|uniref:WcaI family glycosyltransferase n=1 Tax=Novosphingobium sp. TaxID=1874826 RepID=UPI001DD78588|nr:WcaI family glycosyltransferase [Novosphingobium sp.]MCB2057732.1 WcaI family glycosyltransferase [Novosphingobium sp.]MCP5386166.1 WcaI family glycosyltransferase [Novosphingobium sp.]
MKRANILFVGLNYAPEPVGIGPYSQGLTQALVARGHRVEAVVGKPYYPQWRTYPGFAGGGWSTAVEEGVTVTRCPHYVPANPSGARRIAHLASFALSALGPGLRAALRPAEARPKVVVTVAPALLSVFTAWLAAKLAGARLWIHVQDFEVEAALATGLLPDAGWAARLSRWLEARLLRLGDKVSTISPQMCAKLVAKGVAGDRVVEIRNWADTRFAPDPAGAEALRREWGLGEQKVALYSGNIARKQGIEILIEAARLLEKRDDIVFVICGEGPNRAALEQLASGLRNFRLRDLQPAERMGAMLNMADLHLLPQIAGAADLVLPSKLTNMLFSGRPVVATTEPGTGLYDEVDGCGAITPPGDAVALAKAIAALSDDPARRESLGAAARKRAAERWMKEAIIARMGQELDRLA